MSLVQELMSIENIVTLRAFSGHTAKDVAQLFSKNHSEIVIITDKNYEPLGIITIRDLINSSLSKGVSLIRINIEDIMSSPVFTINEYDSIYVASKVMLRNKIKRLVVVDRNNQIVGILGAFGLVKYLATTYINEYDNHKSLKFALDLLN